MRILAIADEESKYLWDYFQKEKLEGIDLILSSGDLNPNYLSFLATFTTAPVLYVREITMTSTKRHRRMDVSVSKIRFMSMKGFVFWDWAVPCATAPGLISILKKK